MLVEDVADLDTIEIVVPEIITVIEDFEGFTDNEDLLANWDMLNGFRTSGGGWSTSSGTLVTNGEENTIEIAIGGGTNGIKLNVTYSELEALEAEYFGFYIQTSTELTGTKFFQAFYYNPAGYTEISTIFGEIELTDEGTYVWIKVSDLPSDLSAVSIMINVSSENTGTLTIDNIAIK